MLKSHIDDLEANHEGHTTMITVASDNFDHVQQNHLLQGHHLLPQDEPPHLFSPTPLQPNQRPGPIRNPPPTPFHPHSTPYFPSPPLEMCVLT